MKRSTVQAVSSAALFHPVDGGAVIYHAATKTLFALNSTAALVWLDIRHGKADAAIEADLTRTFAIDAAQAARWFDAAMTSFDQLQLHSTNYPDGGPAPAPNDVDAPGTDYDFLGRRVRIDLPEAMRSEVESLLRGARRQRGGDIDLALTLAPHGAEVQLTSSSGASVVRPAKDIVAEIEAEIVRHVVPRVPHLLAFHAALLGWGDTAVLFPGISGVGKSTLSTLLATRGWRYGTDEMAMLRRSGAWLGQPFPPCVKAVNYPRVEQWLPSLTEVPELRRFGQLVKFAPVAIEPLEAAVWTVVFPHYGAAAETRLEPLTPLDGLARLLSLCIFVPIGFEAADVAMLIEWHERAHYFTLSFSDAEAAAKALEMLMKGLEPPAS